MKSKEKKGMRKKQSQKAANLKPRTISAILVWAAVALLILNGHFKSELIFFIAIAILIAAVLVYFLPALRK